MSAPAMEIEDRVIESAEQAIRWSEQINSTKCKQWSGFGGLVKVCDDMELRESGVIMKTIHSREEQINNSSKINDPPPSTLTTNEEKERLRQLYNSYQQTMESFSTFNPAPVFNQPAPSSSSWAPPHPPPAMPPPPRQDHQLQVDEDLSALYQSPSIAEARAAAGLPPYLPPDDTTDISMLPTAPPSRK